MKKLDRYVARELVVPFLIGTVAVVLMFQANQLIYQFKTFSLQAIPLAASLQLVIYKTPEYLNMTLPVGMSLAASLALSRLQRESELTAMRVAGAPILRALLPVAGFGLFVAAGNFYVAERVMPGAERQAQNLVVQLGVLGGMPEFKSNVIVNLRNYSASFGSVTRNRDGSLSLANVLLVERPRAGVMALTTAKSGEYRDGVWRLRDTYFWRFEGIELQVARPGQDVIINERITVEHILSQPSPEQQSAKELLKAIEEGKRAGFDTTMLEVRYHTRFSVPVACIVFALVAPVFAIWFARSGGFVGVLLSIFLVFLYYNAFIISTEILGRNSLVSPFVAAWLPNFLFLALGALGIRRLE